MLLKILSKMTLRNHEACYKFNSYFLLRYQAFQANKLKQKSKIIIMKVLSRYDLGQLNINLPKKKYRILASQDDNTLILSLE